MEEPKITSGAVPYIASEIPDDPRDITPEQWEAMKAVDIRTCLLYTSPSPRD